MLKKGLTNVSRQNLPISRGYIDMNVQKFSNNETLIQILALYSRNFQNVKLRLDFVEI